MSHLRYKVRPTVSRAAAELRPMLPSGGKVYILPRHSGAIVATVIDGRVRDLTRAVSDLTGVRYSTHRGTISQPRRGLANSTPLIDTIGFALHGAPALTPIWVQGFKGKSI